MLFRFSAETQTMKINAHVVFSFKHHALNSIVKVFNKIESALFAFHVCFRPTANRYDTHTQIHTMRVCVQKEK